MRFPHFTNQEITIDGLWQGDERQLRLTGTIASSVPFVIFSSLRCSDEYHHYTKHNKSNAVEVPLNLYQSKFLHENRYQHTLEIGHSVNTGAVSEGLLFLSNQLPIKFHTGQVVPLAMDSQNQSFIYLLAIAKVDIKSKRCGIWAVKPRLLEGVDESWLNVLSRTRHGFIRI
jgi:hypothetical protein